MTSLGNRYSQHSFSQVPQANMARSKFDRSYAAKDTMNFDDLVPLFLEEVIPGDTMNLTVKSFCRLATQAVPLMDNMYMDYFFFFVPNRLVWDNWEKFNGAQDNPGDSTDFLIPAVGVPSGTSMYPVNSMADHFGIPTDVVFSNTPISALPFRCYNLIYNQWFRDQNLQTSVPVPKGNGPDDYSNYPLRKRAKKHDYFTSALPWPQKGAAVTLPLNGTAPIITTGQNIRFKTNNTTGVNTQLNFNTNGNVTYSGAAVGVTAGMWAPDKSDLGSGMNSGMQADLSAATGATINALRQAMMMQSLLELDARGGTRYTEILKAHFNVISPDFRLQRPELLSTAQVQINQHPVAQTSETTSGSPQANLAAYSTATSLSSNVGFSKSFVEHGYVIGLVNARADVTYQQGVNRMWSRRTRWDFFWPKLQELGEQAIYNREIFLTNNATEMGNVFGYQERYAEYRYHPSEIRGQFRSNYAQSLDVWHLAQEFGNLPALNSTFIQSNTPIDRALVVTDPNYPDLLCDYWFDLKHARPIMAYGVPATLGRF